MRSRLNDPTLRYVAKLLLLGGLLVGVALASCALIGYGFAGLMDRS